MKLSRLALAVAALAVAAACGSDGDLGDLDAGPGANVAGACTVEDPDCDDTLDAPLLDDEVSPPDAGPGSGLVVDGGLTVSEALTTDATGVLAVKGFIVDDGTTARLCELLAESLPPQCGGAGVVVDGLENADLGLLQFAQGVTWSDHLVVLFGEIAGDVLVVDPAVTG